MCVREISLVFVCTQSACFKLLFWKEAWFSCNWHPKLSQTIAKYRGLSQTIADYREKYVTVLSTMCLEAKVL